MLNLTKKKQPEKINKSTNFKNCKYLNREIQRKLVIINSACANEKLIFTVRKNEIKSQLSYQTPEKSKCLKEVCICLVYVHICVLMCTI